MQALRSKRAATRPKNMQVDAFPAIKSIPSFTQVRHPGLDPTFQAGLESARLRMEVRKASDRTVAKALTPDPTRETTKKCCTRTAVSSDG